MSHSSKPNVLVCGSSSLKNINFDRFINSSSVGEIICGGMNAVDTEIEI